VIACFFVTVLSTILLLIRIAQRAAVSERVRQGGHPWDMTSHLTNRGMCEAFLQVARERYPDMLLKVRENIARAMSGWLIEEGIRAEVRWSAEDNCFSGRLRGFGDEVCFSGETPAEVQRAFAEAVRNHRLNRAA